MDTLEEANPEDYNAPLMLLGPAPWCHQDPRFAIEILLIKTLNILQRVHYLNSKPHSEGVLACQN